MATATACALMGMELTVYMGGEDCRYILQRERERERDRGGGERERERRLPVEMLVVCVMLGMFHRAVQLRTL